MKYNKKDIVKVRGGERPKRRFSDFLQLELNTKSHNTNSENIAKK